MMLQYLHIQRYRWSLQHSVTTDISTDNLTDPLLYIVFQERKQFAATLILPTIDGYFMLFHISTKNNLLGAIYILPLRIYNNKPRQLIILQIRIKNGWCTLSK